MGEVQFGSAILGLIANRSNSEFVFSPKSCMMVGYGEHWGVEMRSILAASFISIASSMNAQHFMLTRS